MYYNCVYVYADDVYNDDDLLLVILHNLCYRYSLCILVADDRHNFHLKRRKSKALLV